MEADLQRFYGIHISELGSHRLTWRRLGVLVAALPREAATVLAVHGPIPTIGDQLLVAIEYRLAAGNWQRQGGKGPKPKPIKLPGFSMEPEPTKTYGTAVPIEEMRDVLDNWGRGATEVTATEVVR